MNIYKELDDIIVIFFMTLVLYSFVIYIFEKCQKYYEEKHHKNNVEGFIGDIGKKMRKISSNFAGDIPDCDGFIFSSRQNIPTCPVAIVSWAFETIFGYIVLFLCCGFCSYLIYQGFTKGPGGKITEALTTEAVNRIKGEKKSSPKEELTKELNNLLSEISKIANKQQGGFFFSRKKKSTRLLDRLNEIKTKFKLIVELFSDEEKNIINNQINEAEKVITEIKLKEDKKTETKDDTKNRDSKTSTDNELLTSTDNELLTSTDNSSLTRPTDLEVDIKDPKTDAEKKLIIAREKQEKLFQEEESERVKAIQERIEKKKRAEISDIDEKTKKAKDELAKEEEQKVRSAKSQKDAKMEKATAEVERTKKELQLEQDSNRKKKVVDFRNEQLKKRLISAPTKDGIAAKKLKELAPGAKIRTAEKKAAAAAATKIQAIVRGRNERNSRNF